MTDERPEQESEEQRSASVGEPAEQRVETVEEAQERGGGSEEAELDQPGDFEAAARMPDALSGDGPPSLLTEAGHSERSLRDQGAGPGGTAS